MTKNKQNIINCIRAVLQKSNYYQGKCICLNMDQLKRMVDYIYELVETDD